MLLWSQSLSINLKASYNFINFLEKLLRTLINWSTIYVEEWGVSKPKFSIYQKPNSKQSLEKIQMSLDLIYWIYWKQWQL